CHLLVQNVRCHGMLPIITGLFKSWDTLDVECFLSTNRARQGGTSLKRRMARARSSVKVRGIFGSASSNPAAGSGTLGSLDIHRLTQMYKKGNPEAFQEKGSRAWMYNYFHGLEQSIYGFELSMIFDGQSYGQARWDACPMSGCRDLIGYRIILRPLFLSQSFVGAMSHRAVRLDCSDELTSLIVLTLK
ncbi:unnamed protein product, partial [Prorocentrum cordatum]